MITAVIAVGFLVAVVAVAAAARHDHRVKRDRRTAYLANYPSVGSVLAVIDKDKYRQIRDQHAGRTEAVHAARAVMRDFPGITVTEAAEVVSELDT